MSSFNKKNSRLNLFIKVITGTLILFLCIRTNYLIIVYGPEHQHDFIVYYHAALNFRNGDNPYQINNTLPFVYHPFTLYLFLPFSFLEIQSAAFIFLILKNIAFVILLYIWVFKFLRMEYEPFFFIFFAILVFNNTLLFDIIVGNITIFENLLLWLAIHYLLNKKKYDIFCFLIIFISFFKLTPIGFLFLLLIIKNPKKYIYLICSLLIFIFLFFLPLLYNAYMFYEYLENVLILSNDLGPENQSLLSFIYSMVDSVNKWSLFPFKFSYTFILAAYLFSCVIMLIILIFFLKKVNLYKNTGNENKKFEMVLYFFCINYALMLPLLKIYSFIFLIIPSYYFLFNNEGSKKELKIYLLVFFLLFSSNFFNFFTPAFLKYNLFISAFLIYIISIRHLYYFSFQKTEQGTLK